VPLVIRDLQVFSVQDALPLSKATSSVTTLVTRALNMGLSNLNVYHHRFLELPLHGKLPRGLAPHVAHE